MSPQPVRSQLDKILASRSFTAAGRARRFLEFAVNQTLEGKQEQIEECLLGVEVFDRAESFDPKLETIVRVEAGKLRKRLQEYHETEGSQDAILIEIPRGSYVPSFTPRDAQPRPTLTPRPRWQFANSVSGELRRMRQTMTVAMLFHSLESRCCRCRTG